MISHETHVKIPLPGTLRKGVKIMDCVKLVAQQFQKLLIL